MEPLQYEARGYLKEPFRLFHLADGRGEYIEYHYHTFHKIIICWPAELAMRWRGNGMSWRRGISCWWAAGASTAGGGDGGLL